MRTPDFTNRRLELFKVKNLGEGSVTTMASSGFGVPPYVIPMLEVGREYYLELYNFNDIGGIMTMDKEYLFHRSDMYFEERLEKFIAENKRKGEERYLANKADYIKRTKELPERYRNRLNRFLDDPKSAESFRKEPMGWGYELIICELAVLYEKYPNKRGSWDDEHEEIKAFAHKHGTSGTQHDVARSWANNPDAAI